MLESHTDKKFCAVKIGFFFQTKQRLFILSCFSRQTTTGFLKYFVSLVRGILRLMSGVKRTGDVIDRILIQLALKVFRELRSSMTSLVRFTPHINRFFVRLAFLKEENALGTRLVSLAVITGLIYDNVTSWKFTTKLRLYVKFLANLWHIHVVLSGYSSQLCSFENTWLSQVYTWKARLGSEIS